MILFPANYRVVSMVLERVLLTANRDIPLNNGAAEQKKNFQRKLFHDPNDHLVHCLGAVLDQSNDYAVEEGDALIPCQLCMP